MYYFYLVVFLVGVLYTFVSLIISGVTGALHSHGDFSTGGDVQIGDHGAHGSMDLGTDSAHGGLQYDVQADAAHLGNSHQGFQTDGHPADARHMGLDINGHHGHSTDNASIYHSILSWFAIIINPLVAVSFLTVFGGLGIMGVTLFKWWGPVVLIVSLFSGIVVSTLLYNFVAKPIYRSENTSDVSRGQLVGSPAEVTTDILENGFGTINYVVNSIKYTGPARHIEERPVRQGTRVVICRIENNTFYVSELSEIMN